MLENLVLALGSLGPGRGGCLVPLVWLSKYFNHKAMGVERLPGAEVWRRRQPSECFVPAFGLRFGGSFELLREESTRAGKIQLPLPGSSLGTLLSGERDTVQVFPAALVGLAEAGGTRVSGWRGAGQWVAGPVGAGRGKRGVPTLRQNRELSFGESGGHRWHVAKDGRRVVSRARERGGQDSMHVFCR